MTDLTQINARIPRNTRALIDAIQVKTGMTITMIIVLAIESYARKLNIKV